MRRTSWQSSEHRSLYAWSAWLIILTCAAALCAEGARLAQPDGQAQPFASPRFEISFPASAHAGPITGRLFVMISRDENPEPRLQVGSWGDAPPLFGADVSQLRPGEAAVMDAGSAGFPTRSLTGVPPGDYYVQALINIYTECHRSDGHTIWVHVDQWAGQQFNISPGNLYSDVEKVHLDPKAGYDVKLSLTHVIPPVKIPPDSAWVKRVKIQSALLTKFWGRPIYLGAVVLLPKGYDTQPNVYYPVIYEQGHFSLKPPFGFSLEQHPVPPRYQRYNIESGYDFYKAWTSPHFPRMIAVTFQHPTPYFDDSYAVNSANNGPYGDAIMTELIPYLEAHFRMIRQPWARLLTGGSTGGWESLALQVKHPSFFGGTWTLYPDPVDFHHDQLVDIYSDSNAFFAPGREWVQAPRPMERTTEGQPVMTMQQMSRLEAVLGSHGRSGQQFEAWEAVYGPAGADGYPVPLWDKLTGEIDPDVAAYMRDHGYDLTAYLEQNWATIGPLLKGKLHIYVGDMDSYYLNLAVYDLQDFLAHTTSPRVNGTFGFGRPEMGHGWEPANQETMIRWMAEQAARGEAAADAASAAGLPQGANTSAWRGN
ncbi:MAG TPA: alpha/beta hydrolase-fold protein [Terriglobia bacterium]|nr:alpha/beta hydrolase-fold protein [Terriglobia bacterium]